MKIKDIVSVDKDILGGTPVFKGTRVPAKNLFDYLIAGDSINDFLGDFDYIPKEYCLELIELAKTFVVQASIKETSNVKAKPSDFRGQLNLTEEQYEDFQLHLKNVKNEWDRHS